MRNEGLREYRGLIIGAVAVLLAFWWGKDFGEGQTRPDDQACEEYVAALSAGAYAWRDVAQALMDPAGYSDSLDRTPAERAQTGIEQLHRAEDINGCSFEPHESVPGY
jgi:hypothetical protein